MFKKLAGNIPVQIFCIAWAVFLFLDYMNASDYFVKAFQYFEYSGLLFCVLLFTAGITYFLSTRKRTGSTIEIRNFRGIYHYVFILLMMLMIVFSYLVKAGKTPSPGAETFAFLFRTLAFHGGAALIFFSAMNIGLYLLSRLQIDLEKTTSALTGLAIGFVVITMGLFLLGAAGILYPFVVIPFLIALMIPGIKKTWILISELLFKKSEKFSIHLWSVAAYAFIILMVGLTLVTGIRTFPIGYDGSGLYLNVAKLVSGYHHLVSGGESYNWSLFMSLGYILYDNNAIVVLLSVVPGILSLVAIYRICIRLNLSRDWSIFACTFFYSLPSILWLSRKDEKTDLALLFITLCCALLFLGNTKSSPVKKTTGLLQRISDFAPGAITWLICGSLVGFTFGIKYVAMLNIFALLILLFYTMAGKFAAIAIFFLNFAIIFALDLTKVAAFKNDLPLLRFVVPCLLGMIALFFAIRQNRSGLILAVKNAMIFLGMISILFLPWAIKNIGEHKNFSMDNMLRGKSPLPELYSESDLPAPHSEKIQSQHPTTISYAGFGVNENVSGLLAQLTNPSTKVNSREPGKEQVSTSTNKEKEEEIRRYLGYEKGIIRFISLPYDLVMKTNVHMGFSDTGILFLIFIPLLMLVFSTRKLPWNIFKMILLLLLLAVSMLSVHLKNPLNFHTILDALRHCKLSEYPMLGSVALPLYLVLEQGLFGIEKLSLWFYPYLAIQHLGLCFALITILAIPIYYLYKNNLRGMSLYTKCLLAFAFSILAYWMVLCSGIIWYGIVGFALIPVVTALIVTNTSPTEYPVTFMKQFVIVCSIAWFILILPFQFMPTSFMYASDASKENTKEFLDMNFIKYAVGISDEKEVLKTFYSPQQAGMINAMNRDKKSRILNVSTFFNFFITNNDFRVYTDNQLGMFEDMFNRAKRDKTLLPAEFKKNKIRYVVVNFKAPTLDMTPDKSLSKKFDQMMMALVNNPQIQLLNTNRLVERPDGDMDISVGGRVVKAKYDIVGQSVIDPGTDALFEIL